MVLLLIVVACLVTKIVPAADRPSRRRGEGPEKTRTSLTCYSAILDLQNLRPEDTLQPCLRWQATIGFFGGVKLKSLCLNKYGSGSRA